MHLGFSSIQEEENEDQISIKSNDDILSLPSIIDLHHKKSSGLIDNSPSPKKQFFEMKKYFETEIEALLKVNSSQFFEK